MKIPDIPISLQGAGFVVLNQLTSNMKICSCPCNLKCHYYMPMILQVAEA